MLDELEQRLDPGERVLYRAPRRFLPDAWPGEPVVYGAALGLLWALGLISFAPPGLWALIGSLAPPLAFTLWVYQRDWSTAGLVSEQRLLQRQGWRAVKITEIPAQRVQALEAELDRMRITLDDGACVLVGHPQDAWGLAVALAHAADVAPPHLANRRQLLGHWCFTFWTLVILVAVSAAALGWLLAHWGWLGFGLLLPLVALISGLVGLALGGCLTVVLGRPFLGFADVTRWVASYNRLYSDDEGLGWDGRLFLWLARKLYGRPLPG